ncbi:hypothetical protein Ahy_A04g020472 isoform A [Arachis hypogaea]|uniref:Uncharacterized protein n=1 Tax=Arachis hypogaea TaxID=3818 RepID=A0A445DHU0_ARAHY|nr:hypothetical protein Ahy_A04g020472 isoform A [Arachis hypogaea]
MSYKIVVDAYCKAKKYKEAVIFVSEIKQFDDSFDDQSVKRLSSYIWEISGSNSSLLATPFAWVNKFSLLSHVCLVNADAGHAVSNAAPTAPSTSIMRGCLTILVKSSILLDIKVRETDVPLDHDAKNYKILGELSLQKSYKTHNIASPLRAGILTAPFCNTSLGLLLVKILRR